MSFKQMLTLGCGLIAISLMTFELSAKEVFQSELCDGLGCVDGFEDNQVVSIAPQEFISAPSFQTVKSKVFQWLVATGVKDKQQIQQVVEIWRKASSSSDSRERFSNVIESFKVANINAAKLVGACHLTDAKLVAPIAKVLEQENAHPFYRNNLGMYYAHYLTQRRMYDEALDVFKQLNINKVVDPATFLFDKAICEHQLLKRDAGLNTITQLLNNTENVPVSYQSIATLMKFELEAIKKDSLDEIARKMSDSERRLNLGRGGQRVQKVQGEIIASLDAIIKKMEDGNGVGHDPSGPDVPKPPVNPAKEPSIKGPAGAGDVNPKKINKQQIPWGTLPEKEAAHAKNSIGKNFPPHYIKAIEEYFKRQAERHRK